MKKLLSLTPLALLLFSPLALAATAVSAQGLVSLVIYLIVIGMVLWLLWWLIAYIGLPEPFGRIIRVILAVVAVLICINLLLGLIGTPLVSLN